jgi:hypothetical protein
MQEYWGVCRPEGRVWCEGPTEGFILRAVGSYWGFQMGQFHARAGILISSL